jgi:cytochrome P450
MNTAAVNPPLLAHAARVPGLPVLGSLLDFRRDRFALQQRVARDYGDVAELRMGFFTVLMVSSPEVAHELLVEKADAFVKSAGLSIFARPLLGDGLLTSEREVHRRQRRMMAPVFAHRRIASYGDVMVAKTREAVNRLARTATIDIADEMMRLTLEIVGKTLFDAELAEDASTVGGALTFAMRQMMGAMIRLVPLPPAIPTPGNLRLRRAVRSIDDIVYAMIRERRASGVDRGDMLGMLLATQDADDGTKLSDREVRDQAMTILLAGHETTANTLAWTIYLLGQNPAIRERVEQEVDAVLAGRSASVADLPALPLTLQVIKESMRLYPPAYMLGRKATREVELGGVRVSRGQVVLLSVAGIHRRHETFPEPDRFDPARFLPEKEKSLPPLAYMPFGAGPRVCIGNHFALMEAHLILATLASRLRFELVDNAPIVPEPLITLCPKGGVPVRVVQREPAGSPP